MQLKGNITLPFLCSQTEENALSDVEVLRLAAAVETNSVHPVGKAIVDAAQAANCHNAKVLILFLVYVSIMFSAFGVYLIALFKHLCFPC